MGMIQAREISYPEPFIPLNYRAMKKKIHDGYVNIWQNMWDEVRSCNITRLFYPEVRESKHIAGMTILELQSLTQIVTGHGLFKRHLRHWNEIDDIGCHLCGEDREDPWHLWNLCPQLQRAREEATRIIERGKVISYEKGLLKFFKDEAVLKVKAINESKITPT